MTLLFLFDVIGDWLVAFFHTHQLVGPWMLLFIEEGGIPLPIPGDVFISYTGYRVSKGAIGYSAAFLSLLSAVLLGSTLLYFLSRKYGTTLVHKYGKYIHLNQRKLNFIEKKFRQYGPIVIIIGRHLPGFRTPLTIFAGLSKVPYFTFIVSEFISVVVWIAIFLQIGAKLGKKTLNLFHNHYALMALPFVIIGLFLFLYFFNKFIPEEKEKT